MDLLDSFKEKIKEFPLRKNTQFLIACSGGVDSVVLLYLFSKLKKERNWKPYVVHFNHGLRGREALLDAKFVESLAKKHKIPVFSDKGNVSKYAKENNYSLEEAARYLRYEYICSLAKKKKVKKVFLAHNLNDQAETVLMRLVKGTGLKGLRGIRPKMRMEGIDFFRPLLSFEKKEILEYAKRHKIRYRKDASNRSKRFLRNRLRLDVVPYLQKNVNPKVLEALARVPEIVDQEILALENLEDKSWKDLKVRKKKNQVDFDRKRWEALESIFQYRLLDRALKKLNPKSGLNHKAWIRLRKKLSDKKYRCSLARNVDFVLTPSKIELYKQ